MSSRCTEADIHRRKLKSRELKRNLTSILSGVGELIHLATPIREPSSFSFLLFSREKNKIPNQVAELETEMVKMVWSHFSPKQQLKYLCFMKILKDLFCTEDMSHCLVMNAINNACIDRTYESGRTCG